jgi:Tfp pilus assembly protein PilW
MNKKIKEKMINVGMDLKNLMIGMLFLFLLITGVIYIFVWLRV